MASDTRESSPDAQGAGFAHAGSYLVCVYESAPPGARVDSMLDAVERLSGVDVIASPIELMSASAVRPLEDDDGVAGLGVRGRANADQISSSPTPVTRRSPNRSIRAAANGAVRP